MAGVQPGNSHGAAAGRLYRLDLCAFDSSRGRLYYVKKLGGTSVLRRRFCLFCVGDGSPNSWRRPASQASRHIFGLFDGEISPSPPAKSRRRRQTRREIWRLDGEIWPSMRELASSRELAFIRFAHTTPDPRCTPRLPAFFVRPARRRRRALAKGPCESSSPSPSPSTSGSSSQKLR